MNTISKTLIRSFDFSVDGPINPAELRHETMQDGLHRAGNTLASNESIAGVRWAASYDKYRDETAFYKNGQLHLKAKAVKEPNPYRENYERQGREQPYGDYRLYGAWVDTWTRRWTPDGHITDPESPNITFEPNTYIEVKVDLSRMCMPGHRFSIWLMPIDHNDVPNRAYNESVADGVEIDIEYDPAMPNWLLCKVVGGAAGQTQGGAINLSDFNLDITQGVHSFGIEWLEDSLVWSVDGVPVNRDTQRVPDHPMYLILSRELNSGVKAEWDLREGDVLESPPLRPADPGLYGASVIESIDKIDNDVVVIESVSLYDVKIIDKPKTKKKRRCAVCGSWVAS